MRRKTGQTGTPTIPESAARQAIRQRAQAAFKRQLAGETLTASEANAIGKWESIAEGERRAQAYCHCAPKDLRELLGVGWEQLRRWDSYGALGRNPDGSYQLAVFLPWLLDHERALVRKSQETAVDALEIERHVRAKSGELDFQKKKGEVGPLEHFRNTVWDIFRGISRTLESFPRRAAAELGNVEPREHEIRHTRMLRELLARMTATVAAAVGESKGKAAPR
jgi:phage terminase Nu1 subunit (DNA packaging protein)